MARMERVAGKGELYQHLERAELYEREAQRYGLNSSAHYSALLVAEALRQHHEDASQPSWVPAPKDIREHTLRMSESWPDDERKRRLQHVNPPAMYRLLQYGDTA